MRIRILGSAAALAVSLIAQEIPGGGNWTVHISKNEMTDAKLTVFSLVANEPLFDGISQGKPEFVILCGSRGWINSKLMSPVVLGRSDQESAFSKEPQQSIVLRADGKIHIHYWNIAPDYRNLFVDRGATKELLSGGDVRIKFRDSREHAQVAKFSPAGIDRQQLGQACGEKVFR